jgi:serine/threonine protein kinase
MIGQQITGQQGGKFTVIREIGRGGFGVVYLVEDGRKRPYAMKLIAPVSAAAIQLSFEQEIKSTVGLSHPNLLAVVDFGTCAVGGQQALFAISEFCPDGDYRRILSATTPQIRGIDAIVADFRQILSGLAVLHTKIIHRDLKPENILVSGAVLKVGDFGLSKFVDEATRTLTFKGGGTPRYMAPEVWLVQRAMPATDLYAVGVMFFEAMTGQPPFSATDTNALKNMHLYTPAPRAKSINSAVPDFLDGVIRKLLEKDPKQRFQTAEELLKAIQSSPAQSEPAVAELAARMRRAHDAEESRRLEEQRREQEAEDAAARNEYKEQEVLALVDEAVNEINSHLAETKIHSSITHNGKEYRFGRRVLKVRFFASGALFSNPQVPGRMECLRKRHAVHGGLIEIQEIGADREGWNLVLVRPPDSLYGEWRIVESRLSPLSGQMTRYEPVATEARLFADNLACHWAPCMHTWTLRDKPLERADIIKILGVFIPKP